MEKDFLYNWTSEQREKFEKTQKKADRILAHYYRYSRFIEYTEETFRKKRRAIMKILENAIESGEIDEGVQMMSRIKSSKSVYDNKEINKNLDDIFATTLVVKDQKELKYLYRQLKDNEKIDIERKKLLNKAQFVAGHLYLRFSDDPNIMECRIQTIEEFESSYPHDLYKANGDKEMSEEQIEAMHKEKQELYDSGSMTIFAELPTKWEAKFDKEEGKMCERQLSTDEVLKELYPFLKLREKDIEKNK